MEDKETGIITGKGLTKYHKKGLTYTCYGGQIKYVIKVQVRDGRYKVDINNIIHDVDLGNAKSCALGLITDSDERFTQGASKKYHNAVVKDIQEKMEVYANSTFENIEKAIASQEEEE
ncbi:MAG: DUF4468 domain-containing protein [Prevotellaceae bacterium]|jgi:hypothetical protein|nr:DUF4468 domain-containing protein [Prevotellaceae bacterium]